MKVNCFGSVCFYMGEVWIMQKSYYEVLEILPTASPETVNGAYRALTKKYHPDVYEGDWEEANRIMAEINSAYEVLSDPEKRKEYDMLIKQKQDKAASSQASSASEKTAEHYTDDSSSTSSGANKQSGGGCSGCISTIFGIIFWVFVIAFLFRACSGDEAELKDTSSTQTSTNTYIEESKEPAADDVQNEEGSLSEIARAIEVAYFHKKYTDLGTVQIHQFEQREKVLEHIAMLGTDEFEESDVRYLTSVNPLFGKEYFEITTDETEIYYVGRVKKNRPHGLGAIFSFATGSGTYEFAGEMLIHYVGYFEDGMFDGYGVLFAADQCDISRTISDISKITTFSEDVGAQITHYLFNHVVYEGYFKENKEEGKGNSFEFPLYDDTVGPRYAFTKMLNPLIDGYDYGPVYPHVTVGKYKEGELSGIAKRYKYNHLVFEGEIQNGEYRVEDIIIPNSNFQIDELYNQNVWGCNLLYDANGFYGFFDEEYDNSITSAPSTNYEDWDDTELIAEYILPYSDSVYLTESDLQDLTKAELRFARNEIYARHGYIFEAEDLREYFSSRSWYLGNINKDEFDSSVFNACELANIELIKSMEQMK